jgi:hypothetical protein
MADRKANPAVVLMRKEIELAEKRVFLQRQGLRQVELDDERVNLVEAIKLTQEQIAALEKEVGELGLGGQ